LTVQSQHYFSSLETLLMRSTNPWYLLTYLLRPTTAAQSFCVWSLSQYV